MHASVNTFSTPVRTHAGQAARTERNRTDRTRTDTAKQRTRAIRSARAIKIAGL